MSHGEVGIDDVYAYSDENGCGHHISAAALNSQLIKQTKIWPDVIEFNPTAISQNINLACSQRGDLLTEYSKMMAKVVRFPESSAFMHCMGCVSSAMTKSFKFKHHNYHIYPNIYVVIGQPPSTGKSGINHYCFDPIFDSYKKYNEKNNTERVMLELEINRIDKKLDSGKVTEEHEMIELIDTKKQKQEKLAKVAYIKPSITNATIEALEKEAGRQGGLFSIISDEADSINIVLGAVYSKDGGASGKNNSEIILKGWDCGYISTTRIGRDGFDGKVRGAISVLAQANSVDTILASSSMGRGIPERFFLLNEPSLLGHRPDQNKYRDVNESLERRYKNLIDNIVMESEVILNFTQSAEFVISNYVNGNEKKMGDDGEYSQNLFTGFMGKAYDQCKKIAVILHVMDNWEDGGQRSLSVNDDYVYWAISIFEELGKTFRAASDNLGHVGHNSEMQKLIEVLARRAEMGKLKVNITSLRDSIKNTKPFDQIRYLQKTLRNKLLPAAQDLNYCVLHGNTIHINPRLK